MLSCSQIPTLQKLITFAILLNLEAICYVAIENTGRIKLGLEAQHLEASFSIPVLL